LGDSDCLNAHVPELIGVIKDLDDATLFRRRRERQSQRLNVPSVDGSERAPLPYPT
jgi:hypothetical protein